MASMPTTEPVCRSSGSEQSTEGSSVAPGERVDHDHVAHRLHAEGAGPFSP
jgi:hypothetical protein